METEIDLINGSEDPSRPAKLLIFDGNNLAMRSIHAMAKSGLSANGVATGPLLVFVNTFSRHIIEEKPDYVLVCWDTGASEFRTAIDPNYKANRTPPDPEFVERKHSSFALFKTFLALSGAPQVERRGYEADDLIAAYASMHVGQTLILSSDKDFLQLLSGSIEQIRFAAGGAETDRWTADRVREEYGCEPDNLPLAMALAGDDSDGVPGVPRFGMKTAIKVLAKHEWDLGRVVREEPRVMEHEAQVIRSLLLVDLRTPRAELLLPPVPAWNPTRMGSAAFEALDTFLSAHRMDSIRSKFRTNEIWGSSF